MSLLRCYALSFGCAAIFVGPVFGQWIIALGCALVCVTCSLGAIAWDRR